jgi:hypothetical protein
MRLVLPDAAKFAAAHARESLYIGRNSPNGGSVMRGGIQLLRLITHESKQSFEQGKTKIPAADGELFVNGALVGTTPAALRLGPGKHLVRVSSGSANEPPKEVTIMSAVGLKLEATQDSICLGLNELGSIEAGQRANWPHKRLSQRHIGPFVAELYYGMSDVAEEVPVRDLNERGLYFWSCRRMPIGGNIDIRMELPFEITPNGGRSVRYRATVLRVEEAPEGKFGTAALIKSCTPS